VRAREARAAAALVDAVAAPEPPLPAVRETDAVASFATWLAHAPAPNRVALRTTLLALAATGFTRRDRAGRLALLRRLGRSPLAEGLRATAAVSYYGSPTVLHTLHATKVPGTFVARRPDSALQSQIRDPGARTAPGTLHARSAVKSPETALQSERRNKRA
jgi:hypothetical protein